MYENIRVTPMNWSYRQIDTDTEFARDADFWNCSNDGTEHEHNYTSCPCSNAWVIHPATDRALRCLTSQLWPDTLRYTVKASSYSEAVGLCVSYIPVVVHSGTHCHYTTSSFFL